MCGQDPAAVGYLVPAAIGTPTLISIVTVCLNPGPPLRACLESVASQTFRAREHIVIDGGSGGETVAILRERSDALAFWSSEPDSGIAEAMNKGLAHCTGDWLLFLHADDRLASPDALASVAQVLEATPADVVGFPIYFGAGSRLLRPRGGGPWLRLKTGFLHQATFIRRQVFERVGGYRPEYPLAMDYEFFLRCWLAGVRMATSEVVVPTHMGDTGLSSRRDWPTVRRRLADERAIQRAHSRNRAQRALYWLYWQIYPAYKRSITALLS